MESTMLVRQGLEFRGFSGFRGLGLRAWCDIIDIDALPCQSEGKDLQVLTA